MVAFLQGGQDFKTETVNGKKYAKQNDTSNTANTQCKSVNKNKICENDWCACATGTNKSSDSEIFVLRGVNIYNATNNQSEKCYLKYVNPVAACQLPQIVIETTGC